MTPNTLYLCLDNNGVPSERVNRAFLLCDVREEQETIFRCILPINTLAEILKVQSVKAKCQDNDKAERTFTVLERRTVLNKNEEGTIKVFFKEEKPKFPWASAALLTGAVTGLVFSLHSITGSMAGAAIVAYAIDAAYTGKYY